MFIMKYTPVLTKAAGRFCLIALVICAAGCSRSSTSQPGISLTKPDTGALSSSAAAALAARLANDECDRLHNKRPFKAEQHAAVLEGEMYRWGRLDPAGRSGLSAVVAFRADGSQPDVRVYFSTDKVD